MAPRLGVFSQYVQADTVESMAQRVRHHGFESIVLEHFPSRHLDLSRPDPEISRNIQAVLKREGISIAAVGGYCNLLHPDAETREAIHRKFRGLMAFCSYVGAPMLLCESGTLHPGDGWDWDPANATEEAFDQLLATIGMFADEAAEYGITIAIEPYVMNVLHAVDRTEAFMRKIGKDNVKLVADPAGLLNRVTLQNQRRFFREMFQKLGPHIGLVHAEDCSPDPAGHFHWLPAGKGLVRYDLFMDELLKIDYKGPLILEHLEDQDMPAAKDFVTHHYLQALARKENGR